MDINEIDFCDAGQGPVDGQGKWQAGGEEKYGQGFGAAPEEKILCFEDLRV